MKKFYIWFGKQSPKMKATVELAFILCIAAIVFGIVVSCLTNPFATLSVIVVTILIGVWFNLKHYWEVRS
jgi:4-hydroxybenzoate polyprenyltransferase